MPNESLRVPVFCPNCSGLMKGKSTFTYYDYKCCIGCYIWFLEGRPATIEKWNAGWRPSPEQMEHYKEMMKD